MGTKNKNRYTSVRENTQKVHASKFFFALYTTNLKLPSCEVTWQFTYTIKRCPMSEKGQEKEKISALEKK
jgi:hypothetical protein